MLKIHCDIGIFFHLLMGIQIDHFEYLKIVSGIFANDLDMFKVHLVISKMG